MKLSHCSNLFGLEMFQIEGPHEEILGPNVFGDQGHLEVTMMT